MHAPAAQQEGYLRGLLTAVDTRWWATPRIVDGVDLAKLYLYINIYITDNIRIKNVTDPYYKV